jgi:hypothetical protein
MSRRIWILFAAGAAASLVTWLLWPEGRSPGTDPASPSAAADPARPGGSAADSAHEDGPRRTGPGSRMPPAPVRMQARSQAPAGPRAGGAAAVFEGESRNDEWAAKREEEVRVRAGRVLAAAAAADREQASLGAVECRSRSCRFSVASSDPAAVARAIEQLGEEAGFYRFADQMTVETAERGEGGPRQVNVFLRFSR